MAHEVLHKVNYLKITNTYSNIILALLTTSSLLSISGHTQVGTMLFNPPSRRFHPLCFRDIWLSVLRFLFFLFLVYWFSILQSHSQHRHLRFSLCSSHLFFHIGFRKWPLLLSGYLSETFSFDTSSLLIFWCYLVENNVIGKSYAIFHCCYIIPNLTF